MFLASDAIIHNQCMFDFEKLCFPGGHLCFPSAMFSDIHYTYYIQGVYNLMMLELMLHYAFSNHLGKFSN